MDIFQTIYGGGVKELWVEGRSPNNMRQAVARQPGNTFFHRLIAVGVGESVFDDSEDDGK